MYPDGIAFVYLIKRTPTQWGNASQHLYHLRIQGGDSRNLLNNPIQAKEILTPQSVSPQRDNTVCDNFRVSFDEVEKDYLSEKQTHHAKNCITAFDLFCPTQLSIINNNDTSALVLEPLSA